jgi:hypothetical protein
MIIYNKKSLLLLIFFYFQEKKAQTLIVHTFQNVEKIHKNMFIYFKSTEESPVIDHLHFHRRNTTQ